MGVLGECGDEGQMTYLSCCPPKLEYNHERGIVDHLRPLLGPPTHQAPQEDEGECTEDKDRACEVESGRWWRSHQIVVVLF